MDEDILVVNGSQQGIDLICKALVGKNTVVLAEGPSYSVALHCFQCAGARVVTVPLLADGPDMDAIRAVVDPTPIDFYYTMTHFQCPSNVCWSERKRREMLALAQANSFTIVEDDCLGDLAFNGRPRQTLRGLDSGNTTTAVDMYLILRYLMSFDAFKEISAAPTFTMPAKEKHAKSFVLLSQNVALNKTSGGRFYRSAMQGGMCDVTAFKSDSGNQSYVSWANKDGATYIFCVMQSPDTCDDFGYANRRPALCETVKLMDWVFDSFSIQAALDTDLALAEIPVKYSSDTSSLQLYPADSMMTLLPSTGDGSVTQKYFHLPDYATAPIQQGDVVGTVELKLAGETIGVVNLIAGQDVHQNPLLFTVSKVQAFFHSLYLKVVIVLSLLTLAVYGLWVFINLWNGRRPNRKIHRR